MQWYSPSPFNAPRLYTSSILQHPQATRTGLLGLTSSLCLVSYAVHIEAFSILSGENTFQAHPSSLTVSVFTVDHDRPVSSLRCISHVSKWHVRVRLDCDSYYEPAAIAHDDRKLAIFIDYTQSIIQRRPNTAESRVPTIRRSGVAYNLRHPVGTQGRLIPRQLYAGL